VVTSTLVFEGPGQIEGYAGGYDDWLIQRPDKPAPKPDKPLPISSTKTVPPPAAPRKKIGYMEKRELESLPGRIEALETRQQELFQVMSDPAFYRQDAERITAVKQELENLEQELESAFARWENLESLPQS
jgi:ATP-binding cassette subfamily F protein uup